LMSRQFVDISRIRIEGLLAAFPKLIGSGNKQHTFVETESVRYVYQPMETLYLLLITNKSSNIMEDLETLKVMAKIVPEFCPELDEEGVQESCFDLIFAFDEVLAMGHRENVSPMQVKTAMEMESHEEKIANMIRQTKMNEAKAHMKERQKEIEKAKQERSKAGLDKYAGQGGGSSSSGFNGGSAQGAFDSLMGDSGYVEEPVARPSAPPQRTAPPKQMRGMKLSASKTSDLMKVLADEGEISTGPGPAARAPGGKAAAPAHASSDAVAIDVEEKLTCVLARDGGLEDILVVGDLKLTVSDPEAAMTRVELQMGENRGFQFKTHPNINKSLWAAENVLSHKDPPRPFPIGSAINVLKWRATKEESLLPLQVNCWPSIAGSGCTVNLEYELVKPGMELTNVTISIPVPGQPQVTQVDGTHHFNNREKLLEWVIDLVDDSNANGSLEFSVQDADVEGFFPINVAFGATGTICDVKVVHVSESRGNRELDHSVNNLVEVESFQVV